MESIAVESGLFWLLSMYKSCSGYLHYNVMLYTTSCCHLSVQCVSLLVTFLYSTGLEFIHWTLESAVDKVSDQYS